MLEFIYTGEHRHFWNISTIRQNFYIDLLRIGHMYNIEKLVNACALKLAEKLDRHNIFVMLELAEKFKAGPLRDASTTFIAENLISLINYPKFDEIVRPSANLLFAILKKTL
jgi:hypothetical protein